MKVYGYLIAYDEDYRTVKTYGFVAANSRAEAVVQVEEDYADFNISEIAIHDVADTDTNTVDEYEIGFFIDAAKENGYTTEGN